MVVKWNVRPIRIRPGVISWWVHFKTKKKRIPHSTFFTIIYGSAKISLYKCRKSILRSNEAGKREVAKVNVKMCNILITTDRVL